ncbi:CACTA en-spm transposon protein [Cucumis melo var. makuwa]|uniref:CACTA en-spm transposon protein n=1 Tax=Cucumis melo var. makuwa TaxID=1194695 RepID=A0A5A7TYY7_CUCMM|nr:CACTA en-spm transposon protein [Cucumis melo var. makuwa]TYK29742.1 CACTA en-spm transposon protein [Cucumis melo var. makuwa]
MRRSKLFVRYIAANGQISMTIAPGAKRPISPHVVHFSQQFFVLDFNDQAMNRFIEHQMLNTFKEFRGDYHRYFKKYSDLEEARANPPHLLHELAKQRGELIDRVNLFRQTHIRDGTFVSLAVEDAHHQMLKLQSQPTPKGSQPLSGDEICEMVLGRRPGYSKGLSWGLKLKARKTTSE